MNVSTYLSIHSFSFYVACVASVSNRVIARKLEREQKKVRSPPPPPPPLFILFFALVQLSRRTSRGNACYAGYFLCAMHFGKRTLKTLLKSVVLISCEKVTTADLGKVGLVFRK